MPPIQATNKFAVEANRPVEFISTDAPFAPTIQTYSGFSLQIDGITIGRLTEWTPHQMDRTVNVVKELNAKTFGQPVDAVPAGAENFTLSFARAEVWGEEVEKAFGEDDIYLLLTNQTRPFSIDEVYLKGRQLYRRYRYLGCWFTSKNVEQFSASGDNQIKISGELIFVNKIRING
jgi:hypothetical protein